MELKQYFYELINSTFFLLRNSNVLLASTIVLHRSFIFINLKNRKIARLSRIIVLSRIRQTKKPSMFTVDEFFIFMEGKKKKINIQSKFLFFFLQTENEKLIPNYSNGHKKVMGEVIVVEHFHYKSTSRNS